MIKKKKIEEEKISERLFKKRIEEIRKETGISLLRAIYQAHTEFTRKEIKEAKIEIACRKGCSHCCYQLVCCTSIEINEIFSYIGSLPKREKRRLLERRLTKYSRKWFDYFEKNKDILTIDPLKQLRDWWGKPCPFLDTKNGKCDIYPVRPIDCRTLTSLVSCREPNNLKNTLICRKITEKGPTRFRFKSDILANNMVLEAERELEGQAHAAMVSVVPVLHWITINEKNKPKK